MAGQWRSGFSTRVWPDQRVAAGPPRYGRRHRLRAEQLERRYALDAVPSAVINGPSVATLIGEEIPLVVTFDNTATNPADIGYSPFVDIVMPKMGDAPPAPENGVTFKPGSVRYQGQSLQTTVLTFDAAGQAVHPFAKKSDGSPVIVPGKAGDQLVVVQLPFGSYAPDQPAIDIDFTGLVSADAQPNQSYSITATGGFRYQTDPAGNPTVDVATIGATTTDPVQPQLFRIKKTSNTPEHETATGPNFTHTYTVSMAVANGQTVTDLLLKDTLPDEVQFVSLTTVSGSGSTTITDISTPTAVTPGGILSRQFDQVVGTGRDSDVQMSFRYYVAQKDANGADVIPLGTGGTTVITNTSEASGKWTSSNPNFPTEQTITSDPTDPDAQYALTARSVALQKSFTNLTNPGSPRAGDTIEYRLNFQVSDFFALGDLAVSDVLSDGQEYDSTFTPTISYTQQTDSISGSFAPANVSATFEANGKQTVDFDVAAQLAALGLTSGSDVLGAAIPAGGTGGAEPSPAPAGPGTTGTIVFRAKVLNNFRVTPTPNAAVVQGDRLTDTANLTSEVLAYADLTPTGETVGDGSSRSFTLVSGGATKTLYAINGATPTAGQRVTAGDDVTFRLTYTVPFSRIRDYKLTDYLPLPVFPAQDLTFAGGGPAATAPGAGQWSFGPTDTFSQAPINGPNPGTATANAAANSVTWTFGSFADPADRSAVSDILFTVTASNKPFGDGLLLTNQAQQSERNETGNQITTSTAVTQGTMSEPELAITKGVVSTSNASGVFTPTPVAPAGVIFSAPGQAGASFTGTINSNGLASTPIDATLENVVGNDLVKFSIIVENTGSGANGAFDVSIKDTLPAGFQIPTGGAGLNLQVTDGMGGKLPYTGDLFGSGIELVDGVTAASGGPGITFQWVDQGTSLVGVYSGSIDTTVYPNPYQIPSQSGASAIGQNSGGYNYFDFTAVTANGKQGFQTGLNAVGSGNFDFALSNGTATGDYLYAQTLTNVSYLGVPAGYVSGSPLFGTVAFPNQSIASAFVGNLSTPKVMWNDNANAVTFTTGTSTQGALATSNPTNGKNIAVITYDLQLAPTVKPLEVITNTATLTNYASTEGGPNYLPPAGITDDTTVTIQAPAVTKTLVGTSIVDTWNSNTQAVIGELVTYDLRVEVPQGTTPAAILTDTFTDALGFVRVVGTPTVDPGVTVGGLANINSPTLTQNGTVAEWQLGDIVNSNTDDQLHGFTFRIEAVVLNDRFVPQVIRTPVNAAELAWTGHTLPEVSAEEVRVIEPQVTLNKTVSPTTAQAGDTATFTIVVSGGGTTAHNLSLEDFLPSGVTYVTGSLAHTAGVAPNTLATSGGGTAFTATWSQLTPNQTSTLTFQATVDANVTSGQAITNTATTKWTSLPGNPGQITPNSTIAYERTGSGSTSQGELNNYTTSDSATVTVAKPTVAKTLWSTSIENSVNSKTQAVIGELATYQIVVTIPQGRTPVAQLIDRMNPGLAYVGQGAPVNSNPAVLSVPGLTNPPHPTSNGTVVTWDLGDIVNTDTDSSTDETITFFVETVVLNVNANHSGVTLNNRAQLYWNNKAAFSNNAQNRQVTVIEPKLKTTKTVSVGGLGGNPGDPVTYTIVIQQDPKSQTNAFDATLTDVLPPEIASPVLKSVNDSVGSVDAYNFELNGSTLSTPRPFFFGKNPSGRTITLTITGTLQGPFTANQQITNTDYVRWTSLYGSPGQITPNNPNAYERTGTGATNLGQLNNYVASSTAAFTVNTADLAVLKTVDIATPNVGETITFTVTVTNNGPSAATGVELTDTFPAAGLQIVGSPTVSQGTYDVATGVWDIGTVLTGGGNTQTLTIQALVLAPAVNTIPAARTNIAQITAVAEPDPNPANNRDDATVTPKYADLGVKKTTSNPTPNAGTRVTYTVSLFNLGTSEATGVKLTDVFPANVDPPAPSDISAPAGTTFLQDLAADPTGRTWTWDVGTVPLSATVTAPLVLTITVDVNSTSTATEFNTVTITTSDVWDPNNRNNSAKTPTTPQQADLILSKTVDNAAPNVGDTLIYTITVDNAGPSLAQDVTVTDTIPAGVTYVLSSDSGSYNASTREVTWNLGNNFPVGQKQLTVQVTVDTPTSGVIAAIDNTATVATTTTDPNPLNNTDTAHVVPLQTDLAVFKVVSDPTPNVGDTLQFAIGAANFGPNDATNVVVTDTIPTGVTYVGITTGIGTNPTQGTAVYDAQNRKLTWTIGALNTSDFPILVFDATVDAPSPAGIPATVTNTAEITGREYDPDPSNNTDSVSETPQHADLAVTKQVSDAAPNVGDTITYTITVTNNGADTATGVTLLDTLKDLSGLQIVGTPQANFGSYDQATGVWTIGSVNVGVAATLLIQAEVLAPASGIPPAQTNTASIQTVDQYDPDPSNNSATATETPQYTDLKVTKTVSDPAPNVGDDVTFTIIVENLGANQATNVLIEDSLPAGLTYLSSSGGYNPGTGVWTVGTVDVGPANAKTLSIIATVAASGSFTNEAEVSTTSPPDQYDPDKTNNKGRATVITREADLLVTKTVDDATPNVGDLITFTVTVRNDGPDTANNVEITDSFPTTGLQLLKGLPSQGTFDAGTGIWTVGTIDVGAANEQTLTIEARVLAPAVDTIPPTQTNVAEVTKVDEHDPNPLNNRGQVSETPQYADLAITKVTTNVEPNVGDIFTYTVTLQNLGTATATNVEVTEVFPNNISVRQVNPLGQTNFNQTATGGTWTIPSIAPGSFKVLMIIAEATSASVAYNTVTITHSDVWDPNSKNNQARTPTNPQQADLSLTKTVDNARPEVNGQVTFTLTLENLGPTAAQSVQVADQLPAGLQFVSANPPGNYNASTGVWTIGTLAASAKETLDITARVLEPAGGTGPVSASTNTGTATSTTVDPNPGNNTDSATVTPLQADLAVAKTASSSQPQIGTTFTYTIEVSNLGPDTATNASVTDLLPTGVTYVSHHESVGLYVPGTGIWTIGTVTTADRPVLTITARVTTGNSGGPVTNTATVTSGTWDPDRTNNTSTVTVVVPPRGVIVGTDVGCVTGPFVRVIDPDTGANRITPFFAYEPEFRGGVRVYGADVTGDGFPNIITAPGPGRPGEVKVFTETGSPLPQYSFFPFGPGYTGGIEIAAGSVTAAGAIEIVASQSRGGTVSVFEVTPSAANPVASTPSRQLQPFGSSYLGGVYVETADVGTFSGGTQTSTTPDGIMELFVGSGVGIAATVTGYNAQPTAPVAFNSFQPLGGSTVGASVARLPSSTPGAADKLLVSAGPRGGSLVETYSGTGSTREAFFQAYGNDRAQVFSAAIDDAAIFNVQGLLGTVDGVQKSLSPSGAGSATLAQSTVSYPPLRVSILRG